MKRMSLKLSVAFAVIAMCAGSLFAAVADGGLIYSTSTDFKEGEWNSNFTAIKAKADAENIPMVVFWANPGCGVCKKLEGVLNTPAAYAWQKERGYLFVFGYGAASGSEGAKVKSFTRNPTGYFPYIAVYWKKDSSTVLQKFSGKAGAMPVKTGDLYNQFIMSVEKYLGSYVPPTRYVGGEIDIDETEGHRLEAESATSSVTIPLIRDVKAAESVTNNLVDVVTSAGEVIRTESVAWTAGQTNQTVDVDITGLFESGSAENGDKAFLVVKDADGTVVGTNSITYVDMPNSALNPLWLGERVADESLTRTGDSVPLLEWGEWTMDYEVATQKVAKAEGDAYTLVAVQGSLWCHDCANTERNFLEVMNNAGEVVLNAWAVSNNVALAVVDVPNFNSASVECQSPTYLSRKGYTTTLAYELPEYGFYDYSLGGAEVELLSPMVRSGLGYLTRKGVTDEAALAVLERNRVLVQTNTDEGGFHRPEDTNKNRTGAPIFVLLRKDGSVAARMTRFASKSPYTADAEKIDDIMKRFDEMLELADSDGDHADDIENNYPGDGAIVFAANGGEAAGEISHCDFTDVFKLEGVGGNALQKVTVTGSTDAEVKVTFLKLGDDGNREYVGDGVTGVLSDGVSLEDIFTEAGDYYVEVTGVSITNAAFAVDSAVAGNFHPFAVSGDVVFVPQQERATGTAAETTSSLVVRLVKDQDYRLQGVDTTALDKTKLKPFSDDAACQFFTALVDGDVDVPLLYGNGASLVYQIWEPGQVGFDSVSATANEGSGSWKVSLSRTDGKSGKVVVSVTLDEEKTDFYNSEGEARFEFSPVDIVWEEGENHKTNVVIGIIEDQRYDGPGDIVLKLAVKEDLNGDTKVVNDTFTLTVKENDVQTAGKTAFVAVEPFFSKKATVYVREGEAAVLYAGRLGASDGAVSVGVRSSLSGVELGGAVTNGVIEWGNHKYDNKEVLVTGVGAGKTATVSLYNAKDGLKILSASNYIRVVGVAAAAPAFEAGTGSAKLYRYVAASNSYPVAVADGAEFTKMTFTKVSGTLPAGLKVSWDKDSNALVLSGVVTAKSGVYTPVYQVVQMNGSKRTPGLTISLEFEVVDFADPVVGEDGETVESVFKKARTFKDIPLVSDDGEVKGLLQLTVPSTGRLSAKFSSASGVTSFSATGWRVCMENDGSAAGLATVLTSRKSEDLLSVTADVDGSLYLELYDAEEDAVYIVEHSGNIWTKANNASDWKGIYTVALRNASVEEDEVFVGIAPAGHGYLTMRMNTSSAYNSGRMTWAGMLPDGTAISGSSILSELDGDECVWGLMPVFKRSTKDVVSGLMKINSEAFNTEQDTGNCQSVFNADDTVFNWTHCEKSLDASYKISFDVYGGIYNNAKSLSEAWIANYSNDPYIGFDPVTILASGGAVLSQPVVAGLEIYDTKFAIDREEANPQKVTLSFNRSTGVLSGSFKLPYTTAEGVKKTQTVRYKGVVLIGWGPGCGCTDSVVDVVLPFVSGAYYFTQRVESGNKRVSVKTGGSASVAE